MDQSRNNRTRMLRAMVAAALLPLFGLPGCLGGTCNPYLCSYQVTRGGNIVIPEGAERLDTQVCFGKNCRDYSLDPRTADSTTPCPSAPSGGVCLAAEPAPRTYSIQASWAFYEELPPSDSMHLRVTDPASGNVLLDESYKVTPHVARQDSCHVCYADDQ